MHQAVWKLTALAGIIGLGLLVVMQKDGLDKFPQLALNVPGETPADGAAVERDPNHPDSGHPDSGREHGIGGSEGFLDNSEPVSADSKLAPTPAAPRNSSLAETLGLEPIEPTVIPSELPARNRTPNVEDQRPLPVADDVGVPIVQADIPREPVRRSPPPETDLLDNLEPPVVERRAPTLAAAQPSIELVETPDLNPPAQPVEPTEPFARKSPRPMLDPEGESFVPEIPADQPAVASERNAQPTTPSVPLELEPDPIQISSPEPRDLPERDFPETVPLEPVMEAQPEPAPTLRDEARSQPVITIQEDEDSIRLPADMATRSSAPVASPRSVRPEPIVDLEPVVERPAPSLAPSLTPSPVNTELIPIQPRTPQVVAQAPVSAADAEDSANFANRDPSAATPAPPTSLTQSTVEIPLADSAATVRPVPVPVAVTIELPNGDRYRADPSRFGEREADMSGGRDPIPRIILPRSITDLPLAVTASRDAISPVPLLRSGSLRPQLTVERSQPESAIVGQPLTYQIVIRNDGSATASGVVVEDPIPDGVRIDGTEPIAQTNGKSLVWQLGQVRAGEERTMSVRVIPLRAGTVGSVARVSFAAEVTASTSVVEPPRPALQLELSAPPRAAIGTAVPFTFRVTNPARVDATNVVVRNVLPPGLRHASGGELEYEMGVLPAGQFRVVQLDLIAAAPGMVLNRATVSADGVPVQAATATIEVLGPQVTLDRIGPKKVYVGRNGRFTNTIRNEGQLAFTNLTLVETLPPGMEFVSAGDGGRYDTRTRQVTWRINRLDVGQTAQVQIELQSTGRGPQVSQVRVVDGGTLSVEASHAYDSHGVAALSIRSSDLTSPLSLGEQINLKTQVHNRGTESATRVGMTILAPRGYEIISARGPTDFKAVTGGVRFDPVARLDGRQHLEFEVVLRGLSAGEGRVQMRVEADQLEEPLNSEEVGTVLDQTR
jgi:uncharacterized repeat protein (TIGR01451 family)